LGEEGGESSKRRKKAPAGIIESLPRQGPEEEARSNETEVRERKRKRTRGKSVRA